MCDGFPKENKLAESDNKTRVVPNFGKTQKKNHKEKRKTQHNRAKTASLVSECVCGEEFFPLPLLLLLLVESRENHGCPSLRNERVA